MVDLPARHSVSNDLRTHRQRSDPSATIETQRCHGPCRTPDHRAAIRRTGRRPSSQRFWSGKREHPSTTSSCAGSAVVSGANPGGNRRSMRELPVNHGANARGRVLVPWLGSGVALDTGVMWEATRSVGPSSARAARRQDRGLRPTTLVIEPSQFLAEAARFFVGGAEAFRSFVQVCRLRRGSQTEGEANLTAIR